MERSVSSAERTRESASKKYRDFQIPWEWMLDSGLMGQVGGAISKLNYFFLYLYSFKVPLDNYALPTTLYVVIIVE